MITLDLPLDSRALRDAYGLFPSGVTALCALDDGTPVGLAASSFTTVSLDPPLVAVNIQSTSTTWPVLKRLKRIGVSVLGEGHDGAARQLSSKTGDRFAGISWAETPDGAVFIEDATAWIDCSIYKEVEAGDHEIVLLEIHGIMTKPHVSPLVFHGSKFRKLTPMEPPAA